VNLVAPALEKLHKWDMKGSKVGIYCSDEQDCLHVTGLRFYSLNAVPNDFIELC
jgi:hypothetical protein